ncbi:MAG: DNA-binding transcriptional regulator Fis [Gammaproteobacteria bacterium]|jgi:Fis family transcriptional regulator
MQDTKFTTLRNGVLQALKEYFFHLEGSEPRDLYALVLEEIEAPLLKAVLEHVKGNQSKAAQILGLSRGTLRKKIRNLEEGEYTSEIS